MNLSRAFLILLLSLPLLSAQEGEKQPAPTETSTHSATLIIRHAGSNTPSRFTGYMDASDGHATFPVLDPKTEGWIASIDAEFTSTTRPPKFYLEIQDNQRLRIGSSESTPFYTSPVQILSVTLPLRTDKEIPVYESDQMKISIRFAVLGD